jgi:hypothetical protein
MDWTKPPSKDIRTQTSLLQIQIPLSELCCLMNPNSNCPTIIIYHDHYIIMASSTVDAASSLSLDLYDLRFQLSIASSAKLLAITILPNIKVTTLKFPSHLMALNYDPRKCQTVLEMMGLETVIY